MEGEDSPPPPQSRTCAIGQVTPVHLVDAGDAPEVSVVPIVQCEKVWAILGSEHILNYCISKCGGCVCVRACVYIYERVLILLLLACVHILKR